MFNTNDKVVCINATMPPDDAALFSEKLVEGRVYAVRGVDTDNYSDGINGLYLVGITGQLNAWGAEFSFCASRFRKLGTPAAQAVQAAGNVAPNNNKASNARERGTTEEKQ